MTTRIPTAKGLSSVLAALLVLSLWACDKRDRPPEHQEIEHVYFLCEKCKSLEGGIYGKGPFKRFDGPSRGQCVHVWQRVTQQQFKGQATEIYGADWSTDILFWNR